MFSKADGIGRQGLFVWMEDLIHFAKNVLMNLFNR